MIFADTGYFIALLNPFDNLHARALLWSRAVREPICTTDYVLLETVNYFSKPVDRSDVHNLLRRLNTGNDCEIILASPALFDAGLQLHAARPDKEWSLTDCISFVVMRQRNITRALAYDHHFEQAGFEPLLRREPASSLCCAESRLRSNCFSIAPRQLHAANRAGRSRVVARDPGVHRAGVQGVAARCDRRFLALAKEKPKSKSDERQAARCDKDFRCVHRQLLCTLKPRKRSALVTTDTLDSAIAPDAMMGLSSQPVNGYRSPAAIGMPSTL